MIMKYWLLIGVFTFNVALAQVHLDKRDYYTVDGNVFIFEEQQKALSIEESWQSFIHGEFKLVKTHDNDINLGLVKNVYWLAIPIVNVLQQNQKFETGIDNGGIFHLEFYQMTTKGKLTSAFVTGTNYKFKTRAIPNRHFFFPLDISALNEAVIIYRIDMRGDGFNIPLRIARPGYAASVQSSISIFYAFYCGWLAFVTIFSFICFFWSRESIYLFYSMYVISFGLLFLGNGNFDVAYIYPDWPWLGTISPSVYVLFMAFFMLLFMKEFLQLKTSNKKLYVLTKVWSVLLIVSILLLVAAYIYSTNSNFRMVVFAYGFVTFVSAWALQFYCIGSRIADGFKPARLYGIALIGALFSTAFYLLNLLDVMPEIIPKYIYLPIGFAFELILLSVALISSYNFYKKKHEELSLDLVNQQLEFSRQLLEAQELEQKRIAQDLHDELGGNLAAIKMNLQTLVPDSDKSAKMIELIDKASQNARHIAHNLMPPEFEETDLEELLMNFYNRLNREGSLCFDFLVTGEDSNFDKQKDLIIYRIILELTNNIIRHSGATTAVIQLIKYNDHLEIVSEDNGKGFTVKSVDGIGLKNIYSRVNFLNGSMNIDSGIAGTTTMITIPFTK
jgi:signal transduction histidine kinase